MSFSKMLVGGAAALALVFGATGCAWFEGGEDESLAMFKVKGDARNARVQGGDDNFNDGQNPAGSADINSMGGINGVDNANAGAGEWNSAAPGPYDDFGRPIPGVTLPTVYFQFDSSRISSAEAPKLDEIAAYLMSNAGTGVVVEGNCDSRGSDEYNRALGERRALAAKEYLMGKGVAESRIRTISYGEERPAVQGDDDATRTKNRRDEFVAVTLRK